MSERTREHQHKGGSGRLMALTLGGVLVVLLCIPLLTLATTASPEALARGVQHPAFLPAFALSLGTSVVSVLLIVLMGTPLAWWLSGGQSRAARLITVLLDIPVVLPPAVIGVTLLHAFGTRGPLYALFGQTLAFSTPAVVLAQLVVAAPFYVQAARNAFSNLDPDLLLVARTLGASPQQAFRRVALPIALPGLLGGVALCWARALGEFGATLLFAGNLSGATQTLPLAIYTALESNIDIALSFSLILGAIATLLLFGVRNLPALKGATSLRSRSRA